VTSFDELMHRAPRGEDEPVERPEGDLGIGRGGAATPPPPRSTSLQLSDEIRAASLRLRGLATLDDLLGSR
jgi:hypothetical protein